MSRNRQCRQHVFKVRLFDSELASLREKAAEAGMDASEFLRAQLSKAVVINRADWRRRTFQLAKIGTNLNQVAHWANSHKSAADAHQVVLALLRIERSIRAEYGLLQGSGAEVPDP